MKCIQNRRLCVENKEKTQIFKETGDTRYIYQSKLSKACFQYDMVYGDFKDLPGRTVSDKALFYNAFNISENP